MKDFKKWYLSTGILSCVLGVLIIIFPLFWLRLVVTLLGISIIVYGIYNIKFVKPLSEVHLFNQLITIRVAISFAFGGVAVLFPLFFGKAMWNAMFWVLISYLFISGICGLVSISLIQKEKSISKKFIIENLFLFVIAVILIIISPNNLGKAIIRIVGIVVLILGLIITGYEIATFKHPQIEQDEENNESTFDK